MGKYSCLRAIKEFRGFFCRHRDLENIQANIFMHLSKIEYENFRLEYQAHSSSVILVMKFLQRSVQISYNQTDPNAQITSSYQFVIVFVDHGLPEMGSAYTSRTGNAIVGAVSSTQLPGFHQFAIFIKKLVQFFEVLHSHC